MKFLLPLVLSFACLFTTQSNAQDCCEEVEVCNESDITTEVELYDQNGNRCSKKTLDPGECIEVAPSCCIDQITYDPVWPSSCTEPDPGSVTLQCGERKESECANDNYYVFDYSCESCKSIITYELTP